MKDSILLPVNPITLRFQSKQLEREYQVFAFKNNLNHIRLCHWIAIFYYALFIFIDLKIFQESSDIFMIIRLGIVCPLFCVGILLTYANNYQSIYHHMLAFYVLLTSAGFLFMGLIVPVEFHFLYFLQLIVCFIFGYTFIRLPYLYASFIGVIAGIAYLFIQFNYNLLNENLLLSFAFCLVGVESLLVIISYTLERSGRYSFYLINLLGIEQDQTKLINTELKEIVEKRTVELQQLEESLQKIKKISGLLPICANCKKVRDDKGYWNQIENYIRNHSEAEFSHGICPECAIELYPEIYKKDK